MEREMRVVWHIYTLPLWVAEQPAVTARPLL
jgi:hypothetical protein